MPSRGTDRVSSEGPAVLVSVKLWVLPNSSLAVSDWIHRETFSNLLRLSPIQLSWIFFCIKIVHFDYKKSPLHLSWSENKINVQAAQHSFTYINNMKKETSSNWTEKNGTFEMSIQLETSTKTLVWTKDTKTFCTDRKSVWSVKYSVCIPIVLSWYGGTVFGTGGPFALMLAQR